MRIGLIVWLAASVALAAPPATQPATGPAEKPAHAEKPAKVKAPPATKPAGAAAANAQQGAQVAILNSQRNEYDRLPFGGKHKLSDIVNASMRGGLLAVSWRNPTGLTGRTRIEVEGSNASWALTATEVMLVLERMDWSGDNPPRSGRVTLNVRPEYLNLTASGTVLAGEEQLNYLSYAQMQGTVRLSVNMRNVNSNVQLASTSLPGLREQNPRAVRRYLLPLLVAMLGTDPLVPGAADVYSVWGAESDSAAAERQLATILPKLGSELPWEREEGTEQLLAMGPQGVVAALRLSRQELSPEQLSRIDGLLMQHTRRAYATAAEARADAMFLIDCLEYPDLAVRKAALRDLSALLGKPVKFDPSAKPEALAEAADALRVSVAEKLQGLPAGGAR